MACPIMSPSISLHVVTNNLAGNVLAIAELVAFISILGLVTESFHSEELVKKMLRQ
jgi:hypothetical protein